ncbi:rod shape-determining protein MreC [Acidaminococcus timonensis]|uniref:rod shape-determining protein MreC n=1 Tax=Acidaminococcus timonensis TaxID=1871002 RepID=UPI0025EC04DE|nr:rod shape-determining protein MreC [Acidaminococcus timonensis]MDD6569068.1 rod shape-determining protein MreC [Acidaminococcus sp.]
MRKEQKARLGALVVILLLIGGVLWDAFHRFPAVNTVLSTLTRPISFVVGGIGGGFKGTGNYFASKSALEKENAALKAENEELRQSNVELIGMKAENERLAKLLKFSNLHPQWKMVSARVISRDLGDFRDVILIDKGKADGLEVNMPVVNASGLIGIVDGVYPHMAKVLLISSTRSRIGGLNLRGDSRAAGIVNGVAGPDQLLEMRNLSRNADILPGDTIVTSGYSGYHPEGLVIGTVEDVQMDAGGLTKTATIAPSVDYGHLEEARVITNYHGFADFLRQEGKDPDAQSGKGGKG